MEAIQIASWRSPMLIEPSVRATPSFKSEVWTITHCLGLGHETVVYAVCLPIFFCIIAWGQQAQRRTHKHGCCQIPVGPWCTILQGVNSMLLVWMLLNNVKLTFQNWQWRKCLQITTIPTIPCTMNLNLAKLRPLTLVIRCHQHLLGQMSLG